MVMLFCFRFGLFFVISVFSFFFLLAFSANVSASTLFYDGFESGSLNGWNLTVNNLTGTEYWTANMTNPYQGNWHAQARPTEDFPQPASVMERAISTTGYQNITFSYYRRLIGFDVSGDEFQVEWFNGSEWNQVENTPEISINDSTYVFRNFSLSASASNQSNFAIRFECSANAMSEYCRVDDVLITGNVGGTLNSSIQNYYGYIEYMPNYSYYLYINKSSNKISFNGINATNANDYHLISYDFSNNFVRRINYVWFSGWFDSSSLYLNQYVGLGAVHYSNAIEVSPGIFVGSIVFPNLPYFGVNYSVPFNVVFDTNLQKSTVYSTNASFVSVSPIDSVWNTGGHPYGPMLFQTKLVFSGSQPMIEVEEWVKEDLATNGLSPRWVSPLIAI